MHWNLRLTQPINSALDTLTSTPPYSLPPSCPSDLSSAFYFSVTVECLLCSGQWEAFRIQGLKLSSPTKHQGNHNKKFHIYVENGDFSNYSRKNGIHVKRWMGFQKNSTTTDRFSPRWKRNPINSRYNPVISWAVKDAKWCALETCWSTSYHQRREASPSTWKTQKKHIQCLGTNSRENGMVLTTQEWARGASQK